MPWRLQECDHTGILVTQIPDSLSKKTFKWYQFQHKLLIGSKILCLTSNQPVHILSAWGKRTTELIKYTAVDETKFVGQMCC